MPRSGLIALSDGVRAYFTANAVPANVTKVGWRYRSWQINQGPGGGSRVCFIPGKIDPTMPAVPKSIDAGAITQPRTSAPVGVPRVGGLTSGVRNPRPLRWWHKIVSVCIWGVDTTDLADDELQEQATEDLVERTIQAMHHAVDPVTGQAVGMADIEIESTMWVLPPVERPFGREFVMFIIQNGPFFDKPKDFTTPKPAIVKGPIT